MAENTTQCVLGPHLYSPDVLYGSLAVSNDLNKSLSGWFVGDMLTDGLGQARQAFNDAMNEFKLHLSDGESATLLNSSTTIYDVEEAVNLAKRKYEEKSPKSRARRWLTSCSSRLMYYSVIMDTLSQHHPEYVSLAWGALKFLFIAVINHEELITEISKTVANIAGVLPRADLSSNLYPTQRMKVAVSRLYAKILHFVRDAIRWYKKGKLAHSVSAILKPYHLGFKTIVEDISKASRQVDEEAAAACRAEIRTLHLKIQHLTQLSTEHFSSQGLATSSMAEELAHQAKIIRQRQIMQITTIPALRDIPNPDESLDYCRSIKFRRRSHILLDPAQITKLQHWHQTVGAFPLLIARCIGLRTVTRDFSVELLDLVRGSNLPVIWALSQPNCDKEKALSLESLLLSLSMQALALNPQVLSAGINPISSYHFENISNEDQGFKLLSRCLSGVKRMYVILELALIHAAVDHKCGRTSAFVQKFLHLLLSRLETGIKLVVVAEKSEGFPEIIECGLLEDSQIFVSGQKPGPRRTGFRSGMTRYSSHVLPVRSDSKSVENWLSAVDGPEKIAKDSISILCNQQKEI